MPKGSPQLTDARKAEIVDACAQLYEIKPFKAITMNDVGEKTSFSRTSIYNYFRTKEEIFLALLEREYRAWTDDLLALAHNPVAARDFPSALAATLEKRGCMLKLLSMNIYDIESGSRLDNLVEFKKIYNSSLRAVGDCLKTHFEVKDEDADDFTYSFFPFLFGVFPYTHPSEKQAQAMDIAGVKYKKFSVRQIAEKLIKALVAELKEKGV